MAEAPSDGFGRYVLEKKLASGGMGEVFLARMQGPAGFEKRVVIKRILPHLAQSEEFVERFLDEGRLVVQLSQANLVQVVDMGVVDEHYYLAMEYVDGLDVRELLKQLKLQKQPFPVELVGYIIGEVARGLAYAHSRTDDDGNNLGIIHRDVSPSNIMLSREGEVKLLDFGIAKATSHMAHSISGSLHGKFLYMSPEQAAARPLDHKSDLFALGICAYEMLTGIRPFQGKTEIETLELIRAGEYVPLNTARPDCPEQLVALVDRCLRVAPEERFADAEDVHRGVLAWLVESRTLVSGPDLAAFVRPFLKPRTPTQPLSLDSALSRGIDELLGEGTGPVGGTQVSPGTDPPGTPARPSSLRPVTPAPLVAEHDSVLGIRPDTGTGRRTLDDLPGAVVLLVGVLVTLNLVMLYTLKSEKEDDRGTVAAVDPTATAERVAPDPDPPTPKPPPTAPPTEPVEAPPPTKDAPVAPEPKAEPEAPVVIEPMRVRLDGLVAGELVTIGGQPVTVAEDGAFEIPEGEGPVKVRIEAPGYEPIIRAFPREVGATAQVEARMVALRKTVRLKVDPPTAAIVVGGRVIGVGTASVTVRADAPVRGRARLDGYEERGFVVRYSGPRSVSVKLTALDLGRFRVRVFPVSAEVRLDGKRINRDTAVVEKRVRPGKHKLTIIAGAKSKTVDFTVRAGQTEKLGQFVLN